MKSRLELTITKDSKNKNVELDSMTLEAAKAFIVLFQSLTNIIELTPGKNDVEIQIEKGSAKLVAYGGKVDRIGRDFTHIVQNKSKDKELVGQWRNLQRLFSANGLQYTAAIYTSNGTIKLLDELSSARTLRTKVKRRPQIETNIVFLTGRLIAVGGKIPNIHVEEKKMGRMIIGCSHNNANKAKAFLYNDIHISTWYNPNKSQNQQYELCDSYYPDQQNFVSTLKNFIDRFSTQDDEIESLKILHYECRKYLDNEDYGKFRKFLRLFNHESTNVNILNTILIITQSFTQNEKLGPMIQSINEKLEKKIKPNKNLKFTVSGKETQL